MGAGRGRVEKNVAGRKFSLAEEGRERRG